VEQPAKADTPAADSTPAAGAATPNEKPAEGTPAN
jgi:hypothetical protein